MRSARAVTVPENLWGKRGGITIFVRRVIDSRGYLPFFRMSAAVMPWMTVAVRGLRKGGPFRVAAATRRVVAAARTRGRRGVATRRNRPRQSTRGGSTPISPASTPISRAASDTTSRSSAQPPRTWPLPQATISARHPRSDQAPNRHPPPAPRRAQRPPSPSPLPPSQRVLPPLRLPWRPGARCPSRHHQPPVQLGVLCPRLRHHRPTARRSPPQPSGRPSLRAAPGSLHHPPAMPATWTSVCQDSCISTPSSPPILGNPSRLSPPKWRKPLSSFISHLAPCASPWNLPQTAVVLTPVLPKTSSAYATSWSARTPPQRVMDGYERFWTSVMMRDMLTVI